MIYLISDTHFNHKNIIKYCNRPENYNDLIWKGLEQLNKEDILLHLGDICFGKDIEVHERLSEYPFHKVLIKGNHDKKTNAWYLNHGWDAVHKDFIMDIYNQVILFTHAPVELESPITLNIHGHLHQSFEFVEPGHLLFSLEDNNYMPINLKHFLKHYEQTKMDF